MPSDEGALFRVHGPAFQALADQLQSAVAVLSRLRQARERRHGLAGLDIRQADILLVDIRFRFAKRLGRGSDGVIRGLPFLAESFNFLSRRRSQRFDCVPFPWDRRIELLELAFQFLGGLSEFPLTLRRVLFERTQFRDRRNQGFPSGDVDGHGCSAQLRPEFRQIGAKVVERFRFPIDRLNHAGMPGAEFRQAASFFRPQLPARHFVPNSRAGQFAIDVAG